MTLPLLPRSASIWLVYDAGNTAWLDTCETEVNVAVDDDRYSRYILTDLKPLQIEYELI